MCEKVKSMCNDEWIRFYDENPPPPYLLERKQQISDFIDYHVSKHHNIALVTSGGTRVDLEQNTVRFVGNFSEGTRGSASAEWFFKRDIAVIFLNRTKSEQPFLRHTSVLEIFESSTPCEAAEGSCNILVQGNICDKLILVLQDYKRSKKEGMILKQEFVTVSDYLHMLYIAAKALQPMGKDAIVYLAAAVSDFYVPQKDMASHKIPSDGGDLNLLLRMVPKMLWVLVHCWCPGAFIVSFKLETDPSVVLKNAKKALEKYGHNLVIANQLDDRKQKVTFVMTDKEKEIVLTEEDIKAGKEIEEYIVDELITIYEQFKI